MFGGLIQTAGDNYEKLLGTAYGEGEYWVLNFNDYLAALGTIFTLLHVRINLQYAVTPHRSTTCM